MDTICIFWFRNDLRLDDNTGLFHALKDHPRILPLFIFDRSILDQLQAKDDARVEFVYREIIRLKSALERMGSSLLVRHGRPESVFRHLLGEYRVGAVYTNGDYEVYSIQRDERIRKILAERGIPFYRFKDQVIFGPGEVLKSDGRPYTVFTPYRKRWLSLFSVAPPGFSDCARYAHHLARTGPLPVPALEAIGFDGRKRHFPPRDVPDDLLRNYHLTRDYPALPGTTRLGIHLRFGTISIRRLAARACDLNQVFLSELIWRDFYKMILAWFPHVETQAFKKPYDNIRWRNDEEEFRRWCRGETGYAMVDAGMRELNETGFMHNRLRMITASFLVKHLLIDWRWGEAYFAGRLLDYDLSSNNGGWQWAASSGCDAAPYFRIFNPARQAEKFDPEGVYLGKWFGDRMRNVSPIVEHSFARQRAINEYRRALDEKL